MLMLSIEQSFDTMMNELNDLLLHQLAINNAIRFSLIVFVQYRRENALGGLDEKAVIPVRSAPRDLHMGDAEGNRMRNILIAMGICNDASLIRINHVILTCKNERLLIFCW